MSGGKLASSALSEKVPTAGNDTLEPDCPPELFSVGTLEVGGAAEGCGADVAGGTAVASSVVATNGAGCVVGDADDVDCSVGLSAISVGVSVISMMLSVNPKYFPCVSCG